MQAKVWNDHHKPYSEMFRDEQITIPAKGHVVMDKSDAIIFMGQYTKPNRLDSGEELNPKMLRLEIIPDNKPAVEKILCQMCKEEFQTKKELALHGQLAHADAIVEDDAKKSKRHATN